MKISRIFPFNFIGDLFRLVRRLAGMLIDGLQTSIRLQLIIAFLICLVVYQMVYAMSTAFFGQVNRYPVIDYSIGINRIDSEAQRVAGYINDRAKRAERGTALGDANGNEGSSVESFIDDEIRQSDYKIKILDLEGKVLKASDGTTETHVDVHNMIAGVMDAHNNPYNDRREYSSFYPIDMNGAKSYLVVSGIPQPNISYNRGPSPLSFPLSAAAFFLLFFWLTKKKMRYVEELAKGLLEISKGNLDYRMEQRSRDELGSLAGNINHMAIELQRTIEEERRAEQSKNELVTNVSHDLRTPLTLIMGYLRLLKDKNYEDAHQAETYINIAYGKSEKLKGLIDDLFEYTKLANQGVRMIQERVCLNELLEQLMEELVTYAEENSLRFERRLPAEKLMVHIDADQIIRVFENLLTNAVKYSEKPGAIKVEMAREDRHVRICIANRGDPIPADELPRLFDRFYRVDAARTSDGGGSGLGLAIAKSIVESHRGGIWAESEDGEVRFIVRLKLA